MILVYLICDVQGKLYEDLVTQEVPCALTDLADDPAKCKVIIMIIITVTIIIT